MNKSREPDLGAVAALSKEAAAMLGCTRQNISAGAMRLFRQRDRTRPPAGIWLPQVDAAMRDGWPTSYTTAGIDATRVFFRRQSRPHTNDSDLKGTISGENTRPCPSVRQCSLSVH